MFARASPRDTRLFKLHLRGEIENLFHSKSRYHASFGSEYLLFLKGRAVNTKEDGDGSLSREHGDGGE